MTMLNIEIKRGLQPPGPLTLLADTFDTETWVVYVLLMIVCVCVRVRVCGL